VVSRGDIAWLQHPEAGRRPALVLTRQAAIPVLRMLLSDHITRLPDERMRQVCLALTRATGCAA
jgi:mRNA-degrading endonuclease toxin of MazEF toxin-antitoxin module